MKPETRERWKRKLKLWAKLIVNWRFLVCFGIGWLITNGWSYILLGIGTFTETAWMIAVSTAYLAFLWLPISPEKVVTVAIACFLVRRLFPKHTYLLQQQIMEATGTPDKKQRRRTRKSAASAAQPSTAQPTGGTTDSNQRPASE